MSDAGESRPVPAVSVVIPAYNGGQLLKRAVEGVIRQSYTDRECIVVDDGGPTTVRLPGTAIALVTDGEMELSGANDTVTLARGESAVVVDETELRVSGHGTVFVAHPNS